MRVSYMRMAIYALTFLTYAYSGYGSGIITTLRDALLAAEVVFEDVFKNLIHVARKFKSVSEVFDAAVEETCIFRCPGNPDKPPLRNKYYTPTSNGCGTLGMQISTEYLPSASMEKCCNEHDICYDTCNNDKELCDIDFKRCLFTFCDRYESSVIGEIGVKGCKTAAKVLFTSTVTLGCKFYLDAQTRGCYCPQEQNYYKKDKKRYNNDRYSDEL